MIINTKDDKYWRTPTKEEQNYIQNNLEIKRKTTNFTFIIFFIIIMIPITTIAYVNAFINLLDENKSILFHTISPLLIPVICIIGFIWICKTMKNNQKKYFSPDSYKAINATILQKDLQEIGHGDMSSSCYLFTIKLHNEKNTIFQIQKEYNQLYDQLQEKEEVIIFCMEDSSTAIIGKL